MKSKILHTLGCAASLLIVLVYIVLPSHAENPSPTLAAMRQMISQESLPQETKQFIMSDVVGNSIRTQEQIFHDLRTMNQYYILRQKPVAPILEYLVQRENKILANNPHDVKGLGIYFEAYLDAFWSDFQAQRESELADREARHVAALEELPEGVTIPTPKASATYQSLVVDLSEQRLFVFEEGILIASSSITSGKRGYSTVTGDFRVLHKMRNIVLKSPFTDPKQQYKLHVDYWINFYKGYGIHDACNSRNCWRTKFGGQDYTTRGSHGCLNTPYDFVAWLYDYVLPNTRVSVER